MRFQKRLVCMLVVSLGVSQAGLENKASAQVGTAVIAGLLGWSLGSLSAQAQQPSSRTIEVGGGSFTSVTNIYVDTTRIELALRAMGHEIATAIKGTGRNHELTQEQIDGIVKQYRLAEYGAPGRPGSYLGLGNLGDAATEEFVANYGRFALKALIEDSIKNLHINLVIAYDIAQRIKGLEPLRLPAENLPLEPAGRTEDFWPFDPKGLVALLDHARNHPGAPLPKYFLEEHSILQSDVQAKVGETRLPAIAEIINRVIGRIATQPETDFHLISYGNFEARSQVLLDTATRFSLAFVADLKNYRTPVPAAFVAEEAIAAALRGSWHTSADDVSKVLGIRDDLGRDVCGMTREAPGTYYSYEKEYLDDLCAARSRISRISRVRAQALKAAPREKEAHRALLAAIGTDALK